MLVDVKFMYGVSWKMGLLKRMDFFYFYILYLNVFCFNFLLRQGCRYYYDM